MSSASVDIGLLGLQVVGAVLAISYFFNYEYDDAWYLLVNAVMAMVTYGLMRQLEAVQIRNLSPLEFELIPTLLMTVCVPLVAFILRARFVEDRPITLKESMRGLVMTAFELTITFAMYRLMPRALNPGSAMGLINAATLFIYSSEVQKNYVFPDPERLDEFRNVPFSIVLGTAITTTVLSVKEPSETSTIRNVKLGIAGAATLIIVLNNVLGTTTAEDGDDLILDQKNGEWLPIAVAATSAAVSVYLANRSSQNFRDMQFRTRRNS